MKVEEKQREEAVNSRKYLEELELKNEKMIEAEQEAEHLLKTELGKAESEKLQLEQSLKVMRERVLGLEKESKDISERMKTVSAGYEKEVAVLSQRVEFLIQEDK